VSLQTRLVALAQAIGADVKQIRAELAKISSGGSSSPWTDLILTSAVNVINQTPVDVMAGFTPVPNTRYLVDVLLSVNSASANNGVQAQLAGPTSGIVSAAVKIVSASSASADLISHVGLNVVQNATANLTAPNLLMIQAVIETGGTVGAGNIRPRVQSETATTSTIRAGSSMRWRTL
jgi:hypothetical protein